MTVQFFRLEPEEWWPWRTALPAGTAGGSDMATIALDRKPFKGPPDPDQAAAGHALEPFILQRLHAYLTACGEQLPPFEQGWAMHDPETRRSGSVDGISGGAVPVAAAEGKAVFKGQAHQWQSGSELARPDGLARYTEIQALHYCDLLSQLRPVPVYVAALHLPFYGLNGMPAEAAVHLGSLSVWVIRPEDTENEREALRELAIAWSDAVRAGRRPTVGGVAFEREERPTIFPGTWDDALLLAEYESTVALEAETRAEGAELYAAARVLAERIPILKEEIRARVGDQRGIVAGGRMATVSKSGSVRVRALNGRGDRE